MVIARLATLRIGFAIDLRSILCFVYFRSRLAKHVHVFTGTVLLLLHVAVCRGEWVCFVSSWQVWPVVFSLFWLPWHAAIFTCVYVAVAGNRRSPYEKAGQEWYITQQCCLCSQWCWRGSWRHRGGEDEAEEAERAPGAPLWHNWRCLLDGEALSTWPLVEFSPERCCNQSVVYQG